MKKHLNSENFFVFASMLCLLTFQFARAITSISIGLFLIAGLWSIIESKKPIKEVLKNPMMAVMGLFYLLLVFDVFKNVNYNDWTTELILKIGLLILPFSVLSLKKISFEKIHLILGTFIISMTISSGISSINYLIDMDAINQLLLQSKHVPLISDVHHIYFGLFLAISCLLSFWLYLQTSKGFKTLWLLCLLLQFVFINLLSSRTGLVSFYAAVYLVALLYFLRIKSWKYRLGISSGLILLPIVAILISPSLRHKISNTKEDLVAAEKGGDDINYKSMAMRMEAWKVTKNIIFKHPIVGVGASNLELEIQKEYETINTILYPENRVGPHNQILESSASHGLLGGLLVIAMFVLPFVFEWKNISFVFVGIWAILGMAILVESVLERQLGILMFGYFYFLILYILPKVKNDRQVIDL